MMGVKMGFSTHADVKRMQAVNALNDARLQALRASAGAGAGDAVIRIKRVGGRVVVPLCNLPVGARVRD